MIGDICAFALTVFAGTIVFIFAVRLTERRLISSKQDDWKLCRPLRVRKITRKEPLTARRAGTVYPDRKEVNEE